ncbi:MAG: AhpC/TSA family protein [Gammaproteobacteria bacterium]|nr:AhpC/TSA family protein [Gammaproteobacteria bacterium]
MKAILLKILPLLLFGSVIAAERTTIANTADEVNPLLIGQEVPNSVLWSASGKPLNLKSLAAEKPVILVFYRGGWCPFCNHQLAELQDIQQDLIEMGYQLIAISPELPDTIKKLQKDRELSYQLMSDFRVEVARAFGVAFRVEDKITDLIKERYDASLQRFKGEPKANLPVPAVFIIDQKGVIQFSYVNPNYQVRLHPELLLTAAKVALKDENIRLKR